MGIPLDYEKPAYFEDADWDNPLAKEEGWRLFRVGTVNGAWRSTLTTYEILAIVNDVPGNGHFKAAMTHFNFICKRDKKDFIMREVWNNNLKFNLVKNGFVFLNGGNDLIKKFR